MVPEITLNEQIDTSSNSSAEIDEDNQRLFLSTTYQRLLCHGQLWAPQEEIFQEAERGADYNSKINWPDGIIAEKNEKKAVDYFNLFFLFQELPNILCYTNKGFHLGLRHRICGRPGLPVLFAGRAPAQGLPYVGLRPPV